MNPNLLGTLVMVLHWSIVVSLFVRVIMRRVPVGVSLAWLTVIAVAPSSARWRTC